MILKLQDARENTVCVDPATGHLYDLRLNKIDVLHRAPWLDDAEIQADETIPLVERRLQGDFFCAPFGKSDLIDAPIHGMTANSPWVVMAQDKGSVRLALQADVMGARIEKSVCLQGEALLQTHRISGGSGGLTVAHHPMVRMADGGRISVSAKDIALTPAVALEPGRSWLSYPAQSTDWDTLPGADGPVDLSRYPMMTGHEDFVTLVEATDATIGWTAIARKAEKDLIVIVKDPRVLPVTMLWFSNGGRDYAPWNGRHVGVFGIEDGCTAGAEGHCAAAEGSMLSELGVKTCLDLGATTHVIEHAIYAVKCASQDRVVDIISQDDDLIAQFADGTEIKLGRAPDWIRD